MSGLILIVGRDPESRMTLSGLFRTVLSAAVCVLNLRS